LAVFAAGLQLQSSVCMADIDLFWDDEAGGGIQR
jgi:hypothetical protein